METISSTIHSLALSIEAEGFGDDSLDLLVMAHAARDLGISEILVQVMIDDLEPEVARLRNGRPAHGLGVRPRLRRRRSHRAHARRRLLIRQYLLAGAYYGAVIRQSTPPSRGPGG